MRLDRRSQVAYHSSVLCLINLTWFLLECDLGVVCLDGGILGCLTIFTLLQAVTSGEAEEHGTHKDL